MEVKYIRNKIKVFISSFCGDGHNREKYKYIREALRVLLEDTNIISTFVYETEPASSLENVPGYLASVDRADLCVFIIDNEDGIKGGLLEEYNRAVVKNKKCLFFFCKEKEKSITPKQQEIIDKGNGRFVSVDNFKDNIHKVYEGIINDVIDIYLNYCDNRLKLVDEKEDVITENNRDNNLPIYLTTTVNKMYFTGYNKCIETITNIFYLYRSEDGGEESNFEIYCNKILNAILYNNKFDERDVCNILKELELFHNTNLIEIIKVRWKAITDYYIGDLEKAIENIKVAYSMATEDESVPNWLVNDLALDLRNTMIELANMNSQVLLTNEGQEKIKSNNEFLYYPIIDRMESEYTSKLLNEMTEKYTINPYTVKYGNGLNSIIEKLTMSFTVSIIYGSLGQIALFNGKISKVIESLIYKYDDQTMYFNLIRLLVLNRNDKKIKSIIRTKAFNSSSLNSDDVVKIYQSTDNLSTHYQKLQSKFIAFKYLGYYLSDYYFNEYSNELFIEFDKWIASKNPNTYVGNTILSAFEETTQRIDKVILLQKLNDIFDKKLFRFNNEIAKVLIAVIYSDINNELEEKLESILIKLINYEKPEDIFKLQQAIILFRKNYNICFQEFDNEVENRMNNFYTESYLIEIGDSKQLNHFVEDIEKYVNVQGINGSYVGRSDPSLTLFNLIKQTEVKFSNKQLNQTLRYLEELVKSDKVTLQSKINAIHLIMLLYNKYNYKTDISSVVKKIVYTQNSLVNAKFQSMMEKDSIIALEFSIQLLRSLCIKVNKKLILMQLSKIQDGTIHDKIESLKAIKIMLNDDGINNISSLLQDILLQFTMQLAYEDELMVRSNVAQILVIFIKSRNKEVAIKQLSLMMDLQYYQVKCIIIKGICSSLDELNNFKEEIELILEKGKADNHFVVKEVSKKLEDTMLI